MDRSFARAILRDRSIHTYLPQTSADPDQAIPAPPSQQDQKETTTHPPPAEAQETIKMKTYVITLSKRFPACHKRAGELTYFKEQVYNAILPAAGVSACDCGEYATRDCDSCGYKIDNFRKKRHTIRANYPLWKKRIAEVERGQACLSIRQWTDKPYRSKQVEIARLTKADGVGVQQLSFPDGDMSSPTVRAGRFPLLDLEVLSCNDGLSYSDWYGWFKKYDLTKPLAIIQFTYFRY